MLCITFRHNIFGPHLRTRVGFVGSCPQPRTRRGAAGGGFKDQPTPGSQERWPLRSVKGLSRHKRMPSHASVGPFHLFHGALDLPTALGYLAAQHATIGSAQPYTASKTFLIAVANPALKMAWPPLDTRPVFASTVQPILVSNSSEMAWRSASTSNGNSVLSGGST